MPNHPVIFSSLPIKYRKNRRFVISFFLFPFPFSLPYHIRFRQIMRETRNPHKVFTEKTWFDFLFYIIIFISFFILRIKISSFFLIFL